MRDPTFFPIATHQILPLLTDDCCSNVSFLGNSLKVHIHGQSPWLTQHMLGTGKHKDLMSLEAKNTESSHLPQSNLL